MNDSEHWLEAALAHHREGRLAEAQALYKQILRTHPEQPDALHFFGLLACQTRDYTAGIALMTQSAALRPDAAHLNDLGNMLREHGRLAQAIERYRHAIGLRPDYPEAHNNLGNALRDARESEAAVRSCARAIELRPDYPEAYNNLGNALQDMGRLNDAAASYRKAIAIRPQYALAYSNLAAVFNSLGEYTQALDAAQRAVRIAPGLAGAHTNMGNACFGLGNLEAAAASYQRALALEPADAGANLNLSLVLLELGHHEEALAHCQRAMAASAPNWSMYLCLGDILRARGDLDPAIEAYRKALMLDPRSAQTLERLLFCMAGSATVTPQAFLADARRYNALMASTAEPFPHDRSQRASQARGRALRVGFVSPDLRQHPVGIFLESVLAHIDRARIEPIAYATHPLEDEVTERLKPRFSAWHSLAGLSPKEAAHRMHADAIDVLVDLAGHTAWSGLAALCWKPAPVQATWLGFFATTGCDAIDYIVCDRHVLPVSEEAHFVEKPWRLPVSYLCFTPPAHAVEVGPLPLFAHGAVTFGYFGKLVKLTDEVVALWSRLLRTMPQARLFLKAPELDAEATQQATAARFAAHRIEAQRLVLEGASPHAQYLAAYGRVDIALSPFPYSSGTTTAEALWMGVPVLCRKGDRFVAHICESLLHAAGLDEWIARDDDEYLERAIAWSSERGRLALLRASLRSRVLASPLCDAPLFARHLEAAFLGMWDGYVNAGLSAPKAG